MKDSNILADNATIKQLHKEVLPNTRGQYMKESTILEDNATINLLPKVISQDTKEICINEASLD